MRDTFNVGQPPHLRETELYDEVNERYGAEEEISDRAAVTIAAWWQAPAGPELAFAWLASSGHVDVEHLLSAIHAVYGEAEPKDRRALDMLITWALNHPLRYYED